MNSTPKVHGQLIETHRYAGCGYLGLENKARVFWQSRMVIGGNVPPLPELTDINQLAKELRNEICTAGNDADGGLASCEG